MKGLKKNIIISIIEIFDSSNIFILTTVDPKDSIHGIEPTRD